MNEGRCTFPEAHTVLSFLLSVMMQCCRLVVHSKPSLSPPYCDVTLSLCTLRTSMISCLQDQAAELVANENILLQTLGFDVAIDHPHTHVVRCCQLVKASKELAQTSYFMATNR